MEQSLDVSSMNTAIDSIQETSSLQLSPDLNQTFTLFPHLPTELRLKIWHLAITPRTLHLNHAAAERTRISLFPLVPSLLHTNHESRTETITQYYLSTLGSRKIYLHPHLDTLLWMRYNGPRSFHLDARKLLHPGNDMQAGKIAASRKFWNRISMQVDNYELYSLIRGGVVKGAKVGEEGGSKVRYKCLVVVDDDYGRIRWSDMKGRGIKLKAVKGDVVWDFIEGKDRRMEKDELWRKWDRGKGWVGDVEYKEDELPEVKFAKVFFEKGAKS